MIVPVTARGDVEGTCGDTAQTPLVRRANKLVVAEGMTWYDTSRVPRMSADRGSSESAPRVS